MHVSFQIPNHPVSLSSANPLFLPPSSLFSLLCNLSSSLLTPPHPSVCTAHTQPILLILPPSICITFSSPSYFFPLLFSPAPFTDELGCVNVLVLFQPWSHFFRFTKVISPGSGLVVWFSTVCSSTSNISLGLLFNPSSTDPPCRSLNWSSDQMASNMSIFFIEEQLCEQSSAV